jgi:ankyrin repeat protein
MQYIKFIRNLYVFIVFFLLTSVAHAGSYKNFFKAVDMDNVRVVQSLLQRGFDPNTVNPEGVPALMLAVRESSLLVAELLASHPEIRAEVRNSKDESVLMLAALKGHLPLVQQLIAKDADVNKTGWTPLHYAASGGHVPVIAYLLDHSAYIDAESPNGTTPLMMAARYGSPEAVKHLIQAGADVLLKNKLGLTAFDFAVNGERVNAQQLITTAIERLAPAPKPLPILRPVQANPQLAPLPVSSSAKPEPKPKR